MNDPNRKIEIDKSSLLSLKAELLRKQEEVSRAKATNCVEDFVPKKAPQSEKDVPQRRKKHRSDREKKSTPVVTELEDTAQLARSKQMLQAKAKYYERMVASGGALNSDENTLVMFNKKKQDTKPPQCLSDELEDQNSDSSSISDSDTNEENEDKWMEYTDCLGRTRKCLKQDLQQCLSRDRELAKSMLPRDGQRRDDLGNSSNTMTVSTEHNVKQDIDGEDGMEIIGPTPSMTAISEPEVGERFRAMRQQWVHQEEVNQDRDSIHYQDVLFDEARLHGVGYYGFSTDQQERSRQRDELDSIRESTIEAQRERESIRKARDKIIADRVKAARARQRARRGLPPEDEEAEEMKQITGTSDQLYDSAEERRRKKTEEKQRKKKEKEERRRERERTQHVRPWDEGKEQTSEEKDWVPAKERFILSQHEWNDLKRSERIAEFAPPVSSSTTVCNRGQRWLQPSASCAPSQIASESSEDEETIVGPMPLLMEKPNGATLSETQASIPLEDIPLPEEEPSRGALFFTTKKHQPKKELKRRNLNALETLASAKQQPIPIRNELSDNNESVGESRQQGTLRKGTEIEPPPTYDYYGPSGSAVGQRKRPATGSNTILEASIEAGLKFLRNQSDKAGGPGTKNRWSSNADY